MENYTELKNELMNIHQFVRSETKTYEYYMKHIKLMNSYVWILSLRLKADLDYQKLAFIALAHDLLKEKGRDKEITWNGHIIPIDLNRYVRTNLDVLAKFELDDYFNSDLQLHALAAGIWLYKELGIEDPEIIYPIMFHSCQQIDIYKTLDPKLQLMIDITMLADKLSSNWLKINYNKKKVLCDLDKLIFGENGTEFNYSMGLYMSRIISQGNNPDKISKDATEYYYKRLKEQNPFINKIIPKGDGKICPERKSQAFRINLLNSKK